MDFCFTQIITTTHILSASIDRPDNLMYLHIHLIKRDTLMMNGCVSPNSELPPQWNRAAEILSVLFIHHFILQRQYNPGRMLTIMCQRYYGNSWGKEIFLFQKFKTCISLAYGTIIILIYIPVTASSRETVAFLGGEYSSHTCAPILTVTTGVTGVTQRAREPRPAWAGVGIGVRRFDNTISVHTVVRWTLVLLTPASIVTF